VTDRDHNDLEVLADLILGINPLYFRAFGPIMNRRKSDTGCNKNQDKALFIISKREEVLPSQLGTCLNMRRGSLTSLVDSLEELGFVLRDPDQDDRRRIWVRLTECGRDYVARRYTELRGEMATFLEELSPADRQRLHRGMADVASVLETLANLREQPAQQEGKNHG